MADRSTRVFLSYAHGDKLKKDDVLQELRHRGIVSSNDSVFDVETLPMGGDIRAGIRQAIEDASALVVLWTNDAAASANVNYEIGMADALGKPIFVVETGNDHRPLPTNLTNLQVIDITANG